MSNAYAHIGTIQTERFQLNFRYLDRDSGTMKGINVELSLAELKEFVNTSAEWVEDFNVKRVVSEQIFFRI